MKLNPLIKIENIEKNKCLVKLLIDNKTFEINKELFVTFLDSYNKGLSRDDMESHISNKLNSNQDTVSNFIGNLLDKKILVTNTADYPVEQIEHWKKRKWLNALIYHLESQNIECIDDDSSLIEDKKTYDFDNENPSNIWKSYNDLLQYKLPCPNLEIFDKIPLEEVLLNRNSFSPFKKKPIPLSDFSNIISAANLDLVNNRSDLEKSVKSLYKSSFVALETYIFVFSVSDLKQGLYHYDPKNHSLSLLNEGDFSEQVTDMCIGQKRSSMGGCLFLITANVSRYMARYKHERAYRNMLINVAEFAHQYIFYSTALGYSTFLTPAIKDDYASSLIHVDDLQELPLYTVTIG